MNAFEFFEHTADIGVRVRGATLPELFANAAAAMFEAMGKLQKSGARSQKSVELRAGALDDLLHDWLAELLFEFEAHHILFDEFEFQEIEAGQLRARVQGGNVDFSQSQPREEIKAVTYHQLKVEQQPDSSWTATVIFDV
jgi:SHS2 domain-containing protein